VSAALKRNGDLQLSAADVPGIHMGSVSLSITAQSRFHHFGGERERERKTLILQKSNLCLSVYN